jgi:hypothetical protein
MHKRQDVSLLVDIGANGEIILGNFDCLGMIFSQSAYRVTLSQSDDNVIKDG